MLLDCDRFISGDLQRWRRLEGFDKQLAQSPLLTAKESRALDAIDEFVRRGPCYVGISWGKDSVVVSHLCWRYQQAAGVVLPFVWVVNRPIENPFCFDVRDAFRRRFEIDYVEAVVDRVRGTSSRYRHGINWVPPGRLLKNGLSTAASEATGVSRYISGVRSEESPIRALRQAHWGESSANTCAPITRWSAVDVFAYLQKHDLPIHPAYAMSMAGGLDRRVLRVHSLGGCVGDWQGRGEWEERYYAPELHAIMHTIQRPEDALWIRLTAASER